MVKNKVLTMPFGISFASLKETVLNGFTLTHKGFIEWFKRAEMMSHLPLNLPLQTVVNKMKILSIAAFFFSIPRVQAQDGEFDILGDEPVKVEKVNYAFKTTKVINLQSLEMTDFGVLDFKMMHRFGALNAGPVNAFGLDQASVRFGLEYGITQNLMVSLGRSNVNGLKNADAFLKYRLMHQNSDNSYPLSILLLAGTQYGLVDPESAIKPSTEQRSSYVFQAILGRKFSEDFSLLLSPTYIVNASNSSWTIPGSNAVNSFALGIGMRQKLSARTTLNVEYIPILTQKGNVFNSFSIGMDVETGGHVFQFHLTNSAGLNETQFIRNTTTVWDNAGIRLGFNLSRVFTIVK